MKKASRQDRQGRNEFIARIPDRFFLSDLGDLGDLGEIYF
jgi:hypothetical protein